MHHWLLWYKKSRWHGVDVWFWLTFVLVSKTGLFLNWRLPHFGSWSCSNTQDSSPVTLLLLIVVFSTVLLKVWENFISCHFLSNKETTLNRVFFFNSHSGGGGVESKLGPLGTSATHWPVGPAPGDCEDGEFGGMSGRGNRSTRRKPARTPLCPPQIPHDQTRDWTRAAAVGSQRLTASAMARPILQL
jgi:hypothetical protein